MAVGKENELRDEELAEETLDDPDPEDEEVEEEEEEDEEEETEDPLDKIRESCEELSACVKLKQELETCNDRVNSKSKTTETCTQELLDFLHCRDHCVSKTVFSKVK